MRFFNTAGPCRKDDHYMLPAAARLPEVRELIERKSYFVIHGPRQSGKTTAMLELAEELTSEGRYAAVVVSMEVGAPFPDDPGVAEQAILSSWRQSAAARLPQELQPSPWSLTGIGQRLGAALSTWSRELSRPLVLFMDEVDSLGDESLVSVLRQLRAGYPDRPGSFPWSLALIGMRDVRDYRVASGGTDPLHSASPFNIKVTSLAMRKFTRDEVTALLLQHTRETGQTFTPQALHHVFYLTEGQPWLVNALAAQATDTVVRDRSKTVGKADIENAKEILIARQDTHLDSLAERLREERVRQVIEPILAGRSLGNVPADDLRFVVDLGLCRHASDGGLVIANPIYREVLPRVLSETPRASLPLIQATWLRPDGSLSEKDLLDAFLAFWRQHGEPLLKSAPYHEIAPHLVMMAFLHRVVNGGGTLEREYAIGTGRMDLCLRWKSQVLGIELKVWRDGEADPLIEGLSQIDGYLAGLGLASGWLVIFDRRGGLLPIAKRTVTESRTTPGGRDITVIRG